MILSKIMLFLLQDGCKLSYVGCSLLGVGGSVYLRGSD